MSASPASLDEPQATLTVNDFSVAYGKKTVIDSLTLPALEPGHLYSLVGPNAAGKSTLLRGMAGLLSTHGTIQLGIESLAAMTLAQRARRVSYMPQTLPQGVALSVLETVLAALRASHAARGLDGHAQLQRAAEVLEEVGIAELALRPLGELSGGQRQLTSLAQVLIREPRVLLLDEPISALDLHHQLRVMQLIHRLAVQRGMIVVAVLHDLQIAARWSDSVLVLSHGELAVAGAPEDAITPATLAHVYGVQARIEARDRSWFHISVDELGTL